MPERVWVGLSYHLNLAVFLWLEALTDGALSCLRHEIQSKGPWSPGQSGPQPPFPSSSPTTSPPLSPPVSSPVLTHSSLPAMVHAALCLSYSAPVTKLVGARLDLNPTHPSHVRRSRRFVCKSVCRSRSNNLNQIWNNRLVPNWERSTSKLYIVTLLI